MKTALSLIALTVFSWPAIAQETKLTPPTATQEPLAEQSHCPISGEVLDDEKLSVDYEGQRVYLCCKKCVGKFNSFPDKWIASLAKSGQGMENIQSACPVSGKNLDSDAITLIFNGKSIKVCCKKCVQKVKNDPATYFDKLEGRKPQEKCAVMGGKIIPKNSFVINGTHIDQCCPGCENKWHAEPAKYFNKLAKKKIVLQPASDRCPVKPEVQVKDRRYFITLGARRFYFSSSNARATFLENPKLYMKNLPKLPNTGPPPAMPAKSELAEKFGSKS